MVVSNALVVASNCSTDLSSDSDTSSDEGITNYPVVTNAKPRQTQGAPLFPVHPDYVPRLPDILDPTVNLSVLGTVVNCVNGCVIICADASAPPLDTGSSLFLTGGSPLGEIYETFGPVRAPFYTVVLPNSPLLKSHQQNITSGRRGNQTDRPVIPGIDTADHHEAATQESSNLFVATSESPEAEPNSVNADDILKSNVVVSVSDTSLKTNNDIVMEKTFADIQLKLPVVNTGDTVYYVPDNADLTVPVFYSQLCTMKGSDASWVGDKEPPPWELDFSDDEAERLHKRAQRLRRNMSNSEQPDVTSVSSTVIPGSKGTPSSNIPRRICRPNRKPNSHQRTPSVPQTANPGQCSNAADWPPFNVAEPPPSDNYAQYAVAQPVLPCSLPITSPPAQSQQPAYWSDHPTAAQLPQRPQQIPTADTFAIAVVAAVTAIASSLCAQGALPSDGLVPGSSQQTSATGPISFPGLPAPVSYPNTSFSNNWPPTNVQSPPNPWLSNQPRAPYHRQILNPPLWSAPNQAVYGSYQAYDVSATQCPNLPVHRGSPRPLNPYGYPRQKKETWLQQSPRYPAP